MNRRLALIVIVLAVLTVTGLGLTRAVREPPRTPHEVAVAVERTLRCPTCQGLSIAESPSSVAEGMRRIVERKASAGRSPDEIRAYFVDRYGEWVLLSPPRRGLNWAIWLLPGVAVTAGLTLAVRAARRRTPTPAAVDESPLARARETYAAYRAGQFTPRASEERVEAALELLASIDGDSEAVTRCTTAREEAMRRLAEALDAGDPQSPEEWSGLLDHAEAVDETDTQSEEYTDAGTKADTSPRARPQPVRQRARPLAYAGGATVFAAAVAVLLVMSTTNRGPGDVITGLLTGPSPQPSARATADVDALRTQARNNPKDPAAWIALGLTLDRQGRPGQAYQAYRHALDLDPANTMARQRAGWALLRSDKPAAAIPLLERGVQRDPQNARSVLLLGLAQYGAGRPDAAATLRRYLGLAPNGPMSARVRALLENQ